MEVATEGFGGRTASLRRGSLIGAVGGDVVVANGVGTDSAEGAEGAAAWTGGFEVAGCVLVVLEMLIF